MSEPKCLVSDADYREHFMEPVKPSEPKYFGQGYRPRGRYILKTVGTGYIREDADAPRKEHTVTTALVERPATLPTDQIDLVRRTVAVGATNDELALYLYDCQRRGIHPLDKLLHFTKRGGKYTPVTSIDFMRAQAAMSGEMAGSDDPVFVMDGQKVESATVTVYRLTQGQRFAYAATARWSEYCPDNAQMWRRMPHTMLGKCAEALALRKAFPQQLAGLYSSEEMQQADTTISRLPDPSQADNKPRESSVGYEAAVVNQGANPTPAPSDDGPDLGVDLPPGARLVVKVGPGVASAEGEITFHNGEHYLTWKKSVLTTAKQFMTNRTPCFPGLKKSASGNTRIEELVRVPDDYDPPKGLPSIQLNEEPPF